MPNVYQNNTKNKNASKMGARRGPQTPRTTPWPLQTTFFRPREPPGELWEVSRRLSGLTRAAPGLAPGPPGPPGFGCVSGCISGQCSKLSLYFWEFALLVCLLRFLPNFVLNRICFFIEFGFRYSSVRVQAGVSHQIGQRKQQRISPACGAVPALARMRRLDPAPR